MPKLSEFKGQEHVTSVLRAMVIKKSVRPFIAFEGDRSTSMMIALAFSRSLNCDSPIKGDACNECDSCTSYHSKSLFLGPVYPLDGKWAVRVVEGDELPPTQPSVVFVKFEYDPRFLNFTLKEPGGTYLDKDLIRLVVFALCGELKELLPLSASVAERMTSREFLTGMTDVFKTLIYVSNNLEVAETENLDLVRRVAVGVHPYHINAAMRLLWDSQDKTLLPDDLSIQTVCVLLSELLHPTPQPVYTNIMSSESDKPIITVEETTGQTLDIAKMLEIAHE